MDIDRRNLMKGLLAGGALLALGTPAWTFAEEPNRTAKRCLLFLGDNYVDERFARRAPVRSRQAGVIARTDERRALGRRHGRCECGGLSGTRSDSRRPAAVGRFSCLCEG